MRRRESWEMHAASPLRISAVSGEALATRLAQLTPAQRSALQELLEVAEKVGVGDAGGCREGLKNQYLGQQGRESRFLFQNHRCGHVELHQSLGLCQWQSSPPQQKSASPRFDLPRTIGRYLHIRPSRARCMQI